MMPSWIQPKIFLFYKFSTHNVFSWTLQHSLCSVLDVEQKQMENLCLQWALEESADILLAY